MNAEQREADQKALIQKRGTSDTGFLEAMSRTDSWLDHEPDTICGMCHHQFLMLLEIGDQQYLILGLTSNQQFCEYEFATSACLKDDPE